MRDKKNVHTDRDGTEHSPSDNESSFTQWLEMS